MNGGLVSQLIMEIRDPPLRRVTEHHLHLGPRLQLRGGGGHIAQIQPAHEIHQRGRGVVQPCIGDGVRRRRQVFERCGDDGGGLDRAGVADLDPAVAGFEGAFAIGAGRQVGDAGGAAVAGPDLLCLQRIEEMAGDLAHRIIIADMPFAMDDVICVHCMIPLGVWSSPSTVTVKNWVEPPAAVATALWTFGTWLAPALPMIWLAASTTRTRPVTPMGLVQRVPPEGFTAPWPPTRSQPPSSLIAAALPRPQKPSPSRIGNWKVENGS